MNIPLLSRNKYMMIPSRLKLATLSEVSFNSQKLETCGKTVSEALERLRELCICHGKPVPQKIPGYEDSYHCGYVNIKYTFKKKTRYNPVWFNRKNLMVITTVYFL
jgi:hypothetical protein